MTQEIHNRTKHQFKNILTNRNSHYLLFAGLTLISLNVGLATGPAQKASAETLSPTAAMTSDSSASESSTQTLKPATPPSTNQVKKTGSTSDADSSSVENGTSSTGTHTADDELTNEPAPIEYISTSRPSIKSRVRPANANFDAAPDNNSKNSNDVPTTADSQHQIAVHYYKRDTTEQLAPDGTMTVTDGQTYTVPSKSFAGYTLSSQTNTTGIYTGAADATFYYAVQKGTVHVYYKTNIGGELLKKTITGNVGEKFTIDALDFNDGDPKDFMLKGAHQVTGTYTSAAQTVTFTYQIPSVHPSTQHGMTVFTTNYADDSLKKIEIIDGNFDIIFGKNSKGHAIVMIHSLVAPLANNRVQLSNKAIANIGKRFGYFTTKTTSYIFEKSPNSGAVKVMQINNLSGALRVTTLSLTAKGTSADTVAKALGISGQTSFTSFWHKYVAENTQATSSIREKDTRNQGGQSQSTSPDTHLPNRAKLPQTSEDQASFSIYGYFMLLLLSILGLLKKEKSAREF